MQTIATRLKIVRAHIIDSETQNNRLPHSVRLLAVSKQQPVAAIREALAAGQTWFAENYLQEALPKIITLASEPLEWHFIGSIQTNKTRLIAEHFTWAHTIDRIKIAERLNDQRPSKLLPLNVCIQVNLALEPQKKGVSLIELPQLTQRIMQLSRLRLRGLMAILPDTDNALRQRHYFKQLRLAYEQLQAAGFIMDSLSMGMSNDFHQAIAEGATIVRIGRAIFGKRPST